MVAFKRGPRRCGADSDSAASPPPLGTHAEGGGGGREGRRPPAGPFVAATPPTPRETRSGPLVGRARAPAAVWTPAVTPPPFPVCSRQFGTRRCRAPPPSQRWESGPGSTQPPPPLVSHSDGANRIPQGKRQSVRRRPGSGGPGPGPGQTGGDGSDGCRRARTSRGTCGARPLSGGPARARFFGGKGACSPAPCRPAAPSARAASAALTAAVRRGRGPSRRLHRPGRLGRGGGGVGWGRGGPTPPAVLTPAWFRPPLWRVGALAC